MSFGFGVGDIIATTSMLSKALDILQNTSQDREGSIPMTQNLRVSLEISEQLKPYLQFSNSRRSTEAIMSTILELHSATANLLDVLEKQPRRRMSGSAQLLSSKVRLRAAEDRLRRSTAMAQDAMRMTMLEMQTDSTTTRIDDLLRSVKNTTAAWGRERSQLPSKLPRVNSLPSTGIVDMLTSPLSKSTNLSVLLVHDLGAHALETWRGAGSDWISDLFSENSTYVTVSTYAYDSLSMLTGNFLRTMQIESKKLLDQMTNKLPGRKIAIFGHGIGCCLVRAAISYCAKAANFDDEYARTLSRLICVVNFGMPDWTIPLTIHRHIRILHHTAKTRSLRNIALLSTWIAQHPISISAFATNIEEVFSLAAYKHVIASVDCCEKQSIITDNGNMTLSQLAIQTPAEGPIYLDGDFFTMCQFQPRETSGHSDLQRFLKNTDELRDLRSGSHYSQEYFEGSEVSVPVGDTVGPKEPRPSRTASPRTLTPENEVSDTQSPQGAPALPWWYGAGCVEFPDPLQHQSSLSNRRYAFLRSLMPLRFPATRAKNINPSTCTWVLQTQACKHWLSSEAASNDTSETSNNGATNTNMLCILGRPMTGKSTLANFILESLYKQDEICDSLPTVLVHVCDRSILRSLEPTTIIKSLIWQLLEDRPMLFVFLYNQYSCAPNTFDELALILVRLLSEAKQLSILVTIDNLEVLCSSTDDETKVHESTAMSLFSFLERIAEIPNVKVLTTITARWFDACLRVDLFEPVNITRQQDALTDLARAELSKHSALRMLSSRIQDEVISSCVAASSGSFLETLRQIHELSKISYESNWVSQSRETHTFPSQSEIILSLCKAPLYVEDLAIMCGGLEEDRDYSRLNFMAFLAAKRLDIARQFSNLDGLYFRRTEDIYLDIRADLLMYTYHKYDNSTYTLQQREWTRPKLTRDFAELCVAALLHYSTRLNIETLRKVVSSYPHMPMLRSLESEDRYPLLGYAVRHWMQHVSEWGASFPVLEIFLTKAPKDFIHCAVEMSPTSDVLLSAAENLENFCVEIGTAAFPGSSHTVSEDGDEFKASESTNGTQGDVRDRFFEAMRRSSGEGVRKLLDNHYDLLREIFPQSFPSWIAAALNSPKKRVATFPLEVLRKSRLGLKAPSELDICFEHERELPHLLKLAIKHSYWDVADGIWTALTDLGMSSSGLDETWIGLYGGDLLHEAILSGNNFIVSALVDEGASCIWTKDDMKITPFHVAATMGREDILTKLVSGSVEEPFGQEDALADPDTRRDLNNILNAKGQSPLLVAAASGMVEAVDLLVAVGFDVNAKDDSGRSALHAAVLFGHEEVVNTLLLAGANVQEQDKAGRTSVHMAAAGNWERLIELLYKQGASPSKQDKQDLTPLHVAAYNGCARAATKLLDLTSGSQVHIASRRGVKPLHAAAEGGSENIVRLLLSKSAPVDAVTKDGETPLHCAARSKFPSDAIVQLLMERCKDVSAKNKAGLTPTMVARQEGHELLLQRLCEGEEKVTKAGRGDLGSEDTAEQRFKNYQKFVGEFEGNEPQYQKLDKRVLD